MTAQAIREPPVLTDRQVYSYLQEMARQVNYALQQVDAQISSPEAGGVAATAARAAQTAVAQQVQNLRALIVQTADRVEAAMDEMSVDLRGTYVARSEWGALREDLSSEITATARDVVQRYDYDTQISELKEGSASFDEYRRHTSAYIKTGLLYFEGDDPQYGVAVGQSFSTETDTQHGAEVITRDELCATFTGDRLSFWQGGAEIAYVSNNQLNIPSANVTGSLRIGRWEITHNNGLTIKYVG